MSTPSPALYDLSQPEGREKFIQWASSLITIWDQENTPTVQMQPIYDAADPVTGVVADKELWNRTINSIKILTPNWAYRMLLAEGTKTPGWYGSAALPNGVQYLVPTTQQDECYMLFKEVAEQVLLAEPSVFADNTPGYQQTKGSVTVRARSHEEAYPVALERIARGVNGRKPAMRFHALDVPYSADPHLFEYFYFVGPAE